ncbi:MAG: DNA polymerase/3'-5' exonuclease PolX [Caldisericia bacterium]
MRNKEISEKFYELASYLEILGEMRFKINAYIEAARRIENLPIPIEEIAKQGKLTEIKGIGEGIAKKIIQYLETGKIDKLEEVKSKIPETLIELLNIPGVGPKGAYTLYKKLGIKNVDDLRKAALEGKIRELDGFGPKKEENILKGLEEAKKKEVRRISLGIALPLAEYVKQNLIKGATIDKIEICGSIRRMKETIGDIDILVTSKNSNQVMDYFTNMEIVKEVINKGDTKSTIITPEGIQIDVRVVEPISFGAAVQYFTGSKQHNVKIRELAIKKGLKVNEYGVFKIDGEVRVCGETEEEVYNILGLPLIPPELREDRGEIELGLENKLPKLVEINDIKGDTHVHTKYSDGENTIYEMALKAIDMGYEYIVIADHAKALGVASGLSIEDFEKQKREIDKINEEFGDKFRIFFGCELNILSDGKIDFEERDLSIFDICLAGIHTGFNQDKKKITERIKRAMNIKKIKIITHPTGRLIGSRDEYEVDLDEIFKEAKNCGTVLEINASYERLDLNDINVMHGNEQYGLKFAIGTDAHSIYGLYDIKYGIGVARRGWLTKKDIINTLSLKEFEKFIKS